ncbi:carbohydrate esterase family 3 protein [Xylaria cf. heliscus]|nr:carbohydrate esterase family 3 protein [Xylaria cf. heliscus]
MLLIQSRPGGVGAQWRQLSKIGKVAIISVAFFFLLAILWGTGTVDVDYVRNQFKNTPENNGDEPIPQNKDETPIIDGVPNDQNDRPIPNGVIEEAEDKQSTENKSGEKLATGGKDGAQSIDVESVKVDSSEKSHAQDVTSSLVWSPIESHQQSPTSSVVIKPVETEPAKPLSTPIAGGIPLRVMFIGASMTLGDPSQSAYRMQLRKWLVSLGNAVNCVGTNRFGQFKDNDVQAFAATPIHILHEKALAAVPEMQPNLIIINAGSSDCFQEKHWGSAHGYDYTKNLVDFLFEASPRATVILSTLVTSPSPQYERCIKSINAQIRQVAVDVRREGKHILLSEQHYDQGLPGRLTPEFIKPDQMHPSFEGWEMMGEIFKQDILDADANGWIVEPVKNGIMDDGDAERDLEEAAKAKEQEKTKKPQEQKNPPQGQEKPPQEQEKSSQQQDKSPQGLDKPPQGQDKPPQGQEKKPQEQEKTPQEQKANDAKGTTTTRARRLRRSHVR